MPTAETPEEIDLESRPIRIARLTFLGSLLFWPLFLFAVKFMLEAPEKSTAALVERTVLIDGAWLYPVAVGLAWFLSRRGIRLGRSDFACMMPWLIPALIAGYWPVYFLL